MDENKNPAIHKGKRFWIGAYDPRDGYVLETHTYEKAQRADFHHHFYFSAKIIAAIDSGEAQVFWVEPNGNIQMQWSPDSWQWTEAPAHIRNAILDQIEIVGTTPRS